MLTQFYKDAIVEALSYIEMQSGCDFNNDFAEIAEKRYFMEVLDCAMTNSPLPRVPPLITFRPG